MDEQAIKEYYDIMYSYEILILAMSNVDCNNRLTYQDAFTNFANNLLKKIQYFCINHVGEIENSK